MFRKLEKLERHGRVDTFKDGVLTGWALQSRDEPQRLYCVIDGIVVKTFTTTEERQDVATAHKRKFLHSGFLVDISLELTRVAERRRCGTELSISITFDIDGSQHLAASPIVHPVGKKSLGSIAIDFSGQFFLFFEHGSPLSDVQGQSPARLSIEDIAVELEGELLSATRDYPASQEMRFVATTAIEPIKNPSRLKQTFDLLYGRFVGGEKSVVACLTWDGNKREFFRAEISALGSYLLNWDAREFRPQDMRAATGFDASLLKVVCFTIQDRSYEGFEEQLLLVIDRAVTHHQYEHLYSICFEVMELLWNSRLWGAYAALLERMSVTWDMIVLLSKRAGPLPMLLFLTRSLTLAVGFPELFADCKRVREFLVDGVVALEYDIWELVNERAQSLLNIHWGRDYVIPLLGHLAKDPALLRFLLTLDIRSSVFRLSDGKSSAIESLTAANPVIESVFLHLEFLVEAARRTATATAQTALKVVLSEVLASCPLLNELIAAINDPSVTVTSTLQAERLLAVFLTYSSNARRCEYSRMQALYSLAAHVDTWRALYLREKENRGGVYSFPTILKNEPRVYMAFEHPALAEALHQVFDDMSTLITLESDAPFLVPDAIFFDSVNLGRAQNVGSLVKSIVDALEQDCAKSTLIFAPWLTLGGADAYCCTTANALLSQGPVKICLTEHPSQHGVSRLLDGIKVIDLSQFMIGFSEEEQSYALSMAVEILKPSRIFNFNSRSFWKCLSKYHNRLSKDRTIACLFFCDDLDGNALKHSYLREHAHIFSTGKIWAIGDSREYFLGVCDELLIPKIRRLPISYPPLRSVAMASAKRAYAATGRVLWCGRFDTQKRLDVLLSVVKISPEKSFDVYGFPLLDSDQTLVEQLRSVSNVHFAGRYENFSELNVDAYDCLLMTTQWEGTPNIVLEAGLRFLPVVAPQVGGVSEVLGDGRGYLIRRFDDVREICAMLAKCGSEREDARIRAQKCYEYVSEHHTEQNLAAALRQMEINQ